MSAEGPAASTPAPPAAEQAPPRRQWLSFGLVGKVSAVIGLIAGALGLLFTIFPGLRPERGEKPTLSIESSDVDGHAPMASYLVAEGIPRGGLSPAALRRLGVLTTLRFTSSGVGGKKLPLVVTLTDRDSGAVACSHRYTVSGGDPAPTFRAWLPFPSRASAGASYDLHVSLFAPDGKPPPLAAKDYSDIAAPTQAAASASAPVPLDVC